jgi:hypothetical protein
LVARKKFMERRSRSTSARQAPTPQRSTVENARTTEKATTYAIERSNLTSRTWNARLNRRTLKFSKDLDRHKASIALMYTFRNFCHVQRNMTRNGAAAMVAGITDHIWDLAELMEAALAEPIGEKPTAKPLVIQRPEGPARELPGDRGWLRVLPGGDQPTAPAAPPVAPPPAPAVAAGGRAEVPGLLPSVVKVRAPVVAPEALPEIPDLDVPLPPAVPPIPEAAPIAEPTPEPVPVETAPVVAAVEAPAPPPPAPPSPACRPRRGPNVDPAQLSLFDPPKK